MEDSLNILIIDDEVDRINVRHLLEDEEVNAIIHEASNCASGREKIKLNKFDCILIDYKLPDATGVEVLEKIREEDQNDSPLILLTGMGDEELATEVMKKGASDYLSKNNLKGETLARSIRNAIQVRSFEKRCWRQNWLCLKVRNRIAPLLKRCRMSYFVWGRTRELNLSTLPSGSLVLIPMN